MSNDHLHFKLRIPENLHLILKIEAAKHRRSITQEITKRLEESFTNSGELGEVDLLLSDIFSRLIKLEEKK